jgi:hypothetical protein
MGLNRENGLLKVSSIHLSISSKGDRALEGSTLTGTFSSFSFAMVHLLDFDVLRPRCSLKNFVFD